MDKKRLLLLAGVDTGGGLQDISQRVFELAEMQAYEEGQAARSEVSGDRVWAAAEAQLAAIKDAVSELVRKEYGS